MTDGRTDGFADIAYTALAKLALSCCKIGVDEMKLIFVTLTTAVTTKIQDFQLTKTSRIKQPIKTPIHTFTGSIHVFTRSLKCNIVYLS